MIPERQYVHLVIFEDYFRLGLGFLRPKERHRSSNLHVCEMELAAVVVHNHFCLNEVRNVSFFINTTGKESSSSARRAST